mmetsp:Transcript_44273/g.102273  ORF Transcript_44273/g.102273 Transcript_44273/m.102273 type:complete len:603 (+) Transcript_44273:85-1893(+)
MAEWVPQVYGAVTAAWGSIMLLCWLLGLVRLCRRHATLRCFQVDLRKWCSTPLFSIKVDPKLEAEVQKRINDMRALRMHSVLRVAFIVVPFGALNNVQNGRAMLQADGLNVAKERAHYIFLIAVEMLGVLFYSWPSCVNIYSLRLAYLCLMSAGLFLALMMAMFDTDELSAHDLGGLPGGAPLYVLINHLMRLCMGVFVQDGIFCLTCHAAFLPLTCCIYVMSGRAEWALFEVFLASMSCSVAISFAVTARHAVCATLNAETSRAFEVATETLLSSICDAVVHLSGDLDLTNDCPRLSALLLKQVSCKASNFCDLLYHEEDKAVLRQFLLQRDDAAAGDMLARTMHTTFRDALGVPVHVQLFHTTCRGGDSATIHIVGVRDIGGERYAPEEPLHAAILDANIEVSSRAAASRSALCCIDELSASLPSEPSLAGDSEGLETSAEKENASVWISALDSKLTMIKWTPEFLCIIGPSALSSATSLLELVPEEERLGFLTRMQAVMNSLAYDDGEERAEVCLQLMTQQHGKVEVKAQINKDVTSDERIGKFVVVLKVSAWRRVRSRKAKTRISYHHKGLAATSPEQGDVVHRLSNPNVAHLFPTRL